MKTKGIRLTKDVLDAALTGGTILGGGGGGDPKKAENTLRLQLIILISDLLQSMNWMKMMYY